MPGPLTRAARHSIRKSDAETATRSNVPRSRPSNTWCSWPDDVRISSRPLRSLISRASSGDLIVREPGSRAPISDSRGRVVESVGRVRNSVNREKTARIVKAYEAGATINVVAAEFGLNRKTVMRHVRKAGAKLRRQSLDAAGVARARALYMSGKTLAQIGEAGGAAPGTVTSTSRSSLISAGQSV